MAIAVAGAGFAFEDLFAPYEPVAEIGWRSNALRVVRRSAADGKAKLLVAQHIVGLAGSSEEGGAFLAEARKIATLASPNVERVRELAVRGDDVVAFLEFVDGEKLAKCWLDAGMTLEVSLRIVLDVLSGCEAIHGLRDAKQRPMGLAHGEVSTATVLLGLDGLARILHAIERRVPGAQAERASLGYLAPEVHRGAAFDARADVFGAGVLLWEALSKRRLFEDMHASAIVARVQGGGIEPAQAASKAPWATSLVQIAARALAASPEDRWPTASSMAAEIRKAAGLRLASATTAAAFAKASFLESVTARRAHFASMPAIQVSMVPPAPELVQAPLPLEAAPTSPAEEEDVVADADTELVPTTLAPPPLPSRALRPSAAAMEAVAADVAAGPAQEPDEESVPYFEAAVDLSVAPPPSASPHVGETTSAPFPVVIDRRASRRRMAAVLGGVGALGLIVFSLAAWRVARHEASAIAVLPPALRAHTAAPATAEGHPDTLATAMSAPAATASAATTAPTTPSAPAASEPPPQAHAAAPSRPSTHAQASPRTPATRKAPAARAAHPKPRPTNGFEPSSL